MRLILILIFFYSMPGLAQFDFKIETPKVEAPKIEAPKVEAPKLEVSHQVDIVDQKQKEIQQKAQNNATKAQQNAAKIQTNSKGLQSAAIKTGSQATTKLEKVINQSQKKLAPIQVQLRKAQKKVCRIPANLNRNIKLGSQRHASLKAGAKLKHSQLNCN